MSSRRKWHTQVHTARLHLCLWPPVQRFFYYFQEASWLYGMAQRGPVKEAGQGEADMPLFILNADGIMRGTQCVKAELDWLTSWTMKQIQPGFVIWVCGHQ